MVKKTILCNKLVSADGDPRSDDEILDKADIPVMPMHSLESLVEDPHLNQTGFFSVVDHPPEGRIRSMAVATKWSDSVPEVTRLAPRLGQHSAEVLTEIGYTKEQIADLVSSGVTADARVDGAQ